MTCRGQPLLQRAQRLQRFTPVFLLATIVACARTPAETAEDLRSDDESTRGSVASWLEDEASNGEPIPREVVDALIVAAPREQDSEIRGDMMRSLGHSGDPRAKAILDAYANTGDSGQRDTASKALQLWVIKTGRFPEDHEFPDDWPYGTEGYPPKLE